MSQGNFKFSHFSLIFHISLTSWYKEVVVFDVVDKIIVLDGSSYTWPINEIADN